MPFDPNSPFVPADPSQWWQTRALPRIVVRPNAPLNGASGNPASSDGINDWFVPGQVSSPTDLPNDWIVPGTAPTDASYPDDWIYPNNQSAPAPPTAGASPAISNRPAPPPDPFAAYWSLILASRVGALAWAPPIFPSSNPFSPQNIPASPWVTPPIFPNAFGQSPSTTPTRPPPNVPTFPTGGLLGGIPKMLAAPASLLLAAGSRGILGALANLQPAPSDAPADTAYWPGSRWFLSPDPIGYQGGGASPEGSTDIQLAQALPPIFFARPPLIPRQLTPLEDLPPGSAGGPGAGQPFPRSFNDQQPEGVPCTYCGRPTTKEPGPDKLHRDHIIPRVQGGNDTPENYAPACRTCNLEKGPQTPVEWYFGLRGGGAT